MAVEGLRRAVERQVRLAERLREVAAEEAARLEEERRRAAETTETTSQSEQGS